MPTGRWSKQHYFPAVQMESSYTDDTGWKNPKKQQTKRLWSSRAWTRIFQVPCRGCWSGESRVLRIGREDCPFRTFTCQDIHPVQVNVLKERKQSAVGRDWRHTDQSCAVLHQIRGSLRCKPTSGYVRPVCSYPPASWRLLQPQSTSLDHQTQLSGIIRQ